MDALVDDGVFKRFIRYFFVENVDHVFQDLPVFPVEICVFEEELFRILTRHCCVCGIFKEEAIAFEIRPISYPIRDDFDDLHHVLVTHFSDAFEVSIT